MSILNLIGALIGGAGFTLVVMTVGWLPALGLFLALWGYGLQIAARRERGHD